jgi:predicted nucleic acid-binding protein
MLVDTGPVVAAVNPRDVQHEVCRDLLDGREGELLVSPYVSPRSAGWFPPGSGQPPNLIDAVAGGELRQVDLTHTDLQRIAELLRRYADLHGGTGLSAADASIVAVAERLNIREIATLDVTDFTLVRPNHVPHFTPSP